MGEQALLDRQLLGLDGGAGFSTVTLALRAGRRVLEAGVAGRASRVGAFGVRPRRSERSFGAG